MVAQDGDASATVITLDEASPDRIPRVREPD